MLLVTLSQPRQLVLPRTQGELYPLLMAFPFFRLLCLLSSLSFYRAEPFIGVNYGTVADNLPPPEETAKLLRSTAIEKLRLYGTDPAMLKALAGTQIAVVIGAANADIPGLASNPTTASEWVNSNVLSFYPATNITLITVGNEVLLTNDETFIKQLLPAMQNIQRALEAASLGGKIKVSTVHSMAVLGQSDPPSAGSFRSNYQDALTGILEFQRLTGSPFAVNPYPFFAYQSDPRPETLAFCLFQPNPGRHDSASGITYMNMFDAQIDAVHTALSSMGFKEVELMVAETGWPSRGDTNEVGPSMENAKAYNGNLIAHLRSMPGKAIDTYIFALYDEDLKPGPGSERSFGLFNTDLSMAYDIGLSTTSNQGQVPPSSSGTPPTSTPNPKTAGWCVPKSGVSDVELQASLDYACGQGIDCSQIQPGGACFEPNTVASHAAYAMNLYYQKSEKNPEDCDFSQTAIITSENPSYNGCTYPKVG